MNRLEYSNDDDASVLNKHGLASVTLSVGWWDGRAEHEEQLHVGKFSVWREADMLPPDIGLNIPGMGSGDETRAGLQPGEMVGSWQESRVVSSDPACFDRNHRPGLELEPRLGRFYPQGFFRGAQGIFHDSVEPARITLLTRERLEFDTNHPLARFPLHVRFYLDRVLPGCDQRGGRCNNPLDELLHYPGLAAPLAEGQATDYGGDSKGMSRLDEREDGLFYARPRLLQHMDARALEIINTLYRRLIPAQSEVLDLMAGFDSHLQGIAVGKLDLLGMNADELAANPSAMNRVVQDLNRAPNLPYASNSLDVVVCTASIEYLVKPGDVLLETIRVLRPGGLFVITFSNRWFPTKAIHIWSELHEFERVGMVTQWLQLAGFSDLHTLSSRGWPRPADDPHLDKTPYSDPVYAVWGHKPEQ